MAIILNDIQCLFVWFFNDDVLCKVAMMLLNRHNSPKVICASRLDPCSLGLCCMKTYSKIVFTFSQYFTPSVLTVFTLKQLTVK